MNGNGTPLRVGTNGCWSSGGLSMSGVTSGLIVTCPNGSSRSPGYVRVGWRTMMKNRCHK